MNSSIGTPSMRPRSSMKKGRFMKTPPRGKNGSFMGPRMTTPTRSPNNAEEFKRTHGIGRNFESKATEFFTNK